MSQCSLFGIESYQQTRKATKGQGCSRMQLDLFGLVKKAVQTAFKKGQRYYVARTGICVRFLRYIGENSLWQTHDGLTWKATPGILNAADMRSLI